MRRIDELRTIAAVCRGVLVLVCLLATTRVDAQALPESVPDADGRSESESGTGEGREPVMVVESTDADEEEARRHFELGRRYYDTGRFAEAAAAFREAYRLSGRPRLLYNLFLALREVGDLDGAVDALERYLETVTDVDERIRVEARLESARRTRDQMRRAATPPSAAPPPARDATLTTLGIALASVGGALLIGSAVTGALALDHDAQLDAMCVGSVDCEEGFESVQSTGFALAVTTDVLWITGAVALASGLVALLADALGGGGAESPSARAALGCSGDGCALVVEGRY